MKCIWRNKNGNASIYNCKGTPDSWRSDRCYSLFSRSSEQRKHQQDLKTQAYVDFIRSFMDAYFKGKKEEYMSRVADATARIAIYGHKR